jgi:hypothetical protein
MSALPPKADIQSRTWDVRYGPKTGLMHQRTLSFDHVVSARWSDSGIVSPSALAVVISGKYERRVSY